MNSYIDNKNNKELFRDFTAGDDGYFSFWGPQQITTTDCFNLSWYYSPTQPEQQKVINTTDYNIEKPRITLHTDQNSESLDTLMYSKNLMSVIQNNIINIPEICLNIESVGISFEDMVIDMILEDCYDSFESTEQLDDKDQSIDLIPLKDMIK